MRSRGQLEMINNFGRHKAATTPGINDDAQGYILDQTTGVEELFPLIGLDGFLDTQGSPRDKGKLRGAGGVGWRAMELLVLQRLGGFIIVFFFFIKALVSLMLC